MNYIYVMSRADGAHKIGYSNSPRTRRNGISTVMGERVDIVHFVERPGGDAGVVERICHAMLDDRAICGEWFLIGAERAVETVTAACGLADMHGRSILSTLPAVPRLSWKYDRLYKKVLAENPGIEPEEFLNVWRALAHLVADERSLDRYERGRDAWNKALSEGRVGRRAAPLDERVRAMQSALRNGESLRAVAARFGMSHEGVRKAVARIRRGSP